MKVTIAGVPQEVRDDYARRLIEQGKAVPSPTQATPKAAKPKAKKAEDVKQDEPEKQD